MCETVGVIGNGFVGDAVTNGFRAAGVDVRVYDADEARSEHSFVEAACCDFVFVCVPTPSSVENGDQDLRIVDDVVTGLVQLRSARQPVGVVVIKSTVLPRAVNAYRTTYPELRFLSNPEFLSARTAREDFMNPTRIVIGTDELCEPFAQRLGALYARIKSNARVLYVSHDEAALIKYASNCFFATKISFMNELWQICDRTHADYDVVREGMIASGWVSEMHTRVPGPDGHFGFGGKCFPKDIAALARFGSSIGVPTRMLRATIGKNFDVRDDRDWERIDGAFSCD